MTVIGSVPSPNDNSPFAPSEPRHFVVETSVYDASKAAPVHFSVACYFENTKRWQKVSLSPSGTFLCITANVAGRTTDANLLALPVLDLAYLLAKIWSGSSHANSDRNANFEAVISLGGPGRLHPFQATTHIGSCNRACLSPSSDDTNRSPPPTDRQYNGAFIHPLSFVSHCWS